ncbi:M48 family metalloprotease [Treponema sp. R80B11-R83G3]
MTIEDYCTYIVNTYLLTTKEKEELDCLFKKIGKKFDFEMSTIFNPDDIHIRELASELFKTIKNEKRDFNIEYLIITLPIGNCNALAAELSSCKLIVLDACAMKLYGDIAKLIDKLAPKYKGEIAPNPENLNIGNIEEIENLKNEIRELIKNDIYNEFKKSILAFNGKMRNSIDNEKEPVGIAKQICDACILFLLGHEFGHIVENHKIINDNEENATQRRWAQEAEADVISYKLMVKTMELLYPETMYKGQFDFGFEIFFQCISIVEPLTIILDNKNKYEYSINHPDASSSRLEILRLFSIKSVSDKETHIFNIIVSNEIFDNVTNKLISEIICNAANIDSKNEGINEWKNEHYSSAVRKFKDDKYSRRFKKIIAVFYDYIIERSYTRMYSCAAQEECFINGIEYLKQEIYDEAVKCFLDALEKHNSLITRLAYGLSCSLIGQRFLYEKKNYKKAEAFFKRDIEINHLAGRESFKGLMVALKKQKKGHSASENGEIYKILSLVPSKAERVMEFMKTNNS